MEKYFEKSAESLMATGVDEDALRTKKGIILSATPYRIAEGGTTNEGISIYYMFTKTLDPVSFPNSDSKGIRVGKASLPIDAKSHLMAVPGYYDFLVQEQAGSNMSMVLKPKDVHLLGQLDLKIEMLPDGSVEKAMDAAEEYRAAHPYSTGAKKKDKPEEKSGDK